MPRTFDLDDDPATDDDGGPSGVPLFEAPLRRYEIGRELGRGGIGRVVVATDHSLGREVAVKSLLRADAGRSPSSPPVGRLLREARLTARIEHPNVVPIHDVGVDAEGLPFYVMRRIDGISLADALARCPDLDARMRLLPHVVRCAYAVAFAHSRQVVHRDLKPSNLMIGEFGETFVVDWGHAATVAAPDPVALDHGTGGAPDGTLSGAIVGTPAYMSPEQARGDRASVGAPADVFCLGGMLYEVLTGRPPYVADEVEHTLRLAAAGEITPVLALAPGAPRELAAIAHKALAPRVQDRYTDAAAIAREIEAWQQGDRVSAYAYSSAELVRRLISRHRRGLAVALVLGWAALAGGAVALARIRQERDRAVAAERARTDALFEALRSSAQGSAREGDHHAARIDYARALGLREDPEARGWLLGWPGQATVYPVTRVEGSDGCSTVRPSPEGTRLACNAPGEIRVWSWSDLGASPQVFDGYLDTPFWHWVDDVRFVARDGSGRVDLRSLDGTVVSRQLASPAGIVADAERVFVLDLAGEDVNLIELDATGLREVRTTSTGERRTGRLALSRDGQLGLARTSDVQTMRRDGSPGPTLPLKSVRTLQWSADGTRLWTGTGQGVLSVSDLVAGTTRTVAAPRPEQGGLTTVALSADGTMAATRSDDGRMRVYDEGGVLLASMGPCTDVAFGPGETLLLADGNVTVWGTAHAPGPQGFATVTEMTKLLPGEGAEVQVWARGAPVLVLDWVDGSRRTLTERGGDQSLRNGPTIQSPDGTIRVFDPVTLERVDLPEILRDGRWLSGDAVPRQHRFAALRGGGHLVVSRAGDVSETTVPPDLRWVTFAGPTLLGFPRVGDVLVLDPPGTPFALGAGEARTGVTTLPVTGRVAVSYPQRVEIFEAATLAAGMSTPLRVLRTSANGEMAESPDGTWLAIADRRNQVRVFRQSDGEGVAIVPRLSSEVRALAFSGDGSTLAVGYAQGRVSLLATDTLTAPPERLLAEALRDAGRASP